MVQSGGVGVGGYLRPDQFLDHLTVMIRWRCPSLNVVITRIELLEVAYNANKQLVVFVSHPLSFLLSFLSFFFLGGWGNSSLSAADFLGLPTTNVTLVFES